MPPTATYRIQFTPEFGFDDARSILPYLDELGISDIYASPILAARTGSSHGYDGVDPNRICPRLGGAEDFRKLRREMGERGMGWLQDIVPNHMAFHPENRMLMDLLEKGEASAYHRFFDIDWNHPDPGLRGRILVPFLGGRYGDLLNNGEIRIGWDGRGFSFLYYEWVLPLSPWTYGHFLEGDGRVPPDALRDLLSGIREVPETDPFRIDDLKGDLAALRRDDPAVRAWIDDRLERVNGDPARFDAVMVRQHFRPSFWRVAEHEIDYRRFFHINDLICLRAEDPLVFDHTHRTILELTRDGTFTGLRIDHVDGLADPLSYLRSLRRAAGEVYIVVEKILGEAEALPASWPIQGTTGYAFLNQVNGLFCRRDAAARFEEIYGDFLGAPPAPAGLVIDHRMRVLQAHMAGEVENVVRRLRNLARTRIEGRDLTRRNLKRALQAVMVRLPVYRTYLEDPGVRETDLRHLNAAVEGAVVALPGLKPEAAAIRKILLGKWGTGPEWADLVQRFQQLTAPLAAKGFEDTTLYVYNRLISLNEVGGEPSRFGLSVEDFHGAMADRARNRPHAMSATATHDTKRGEDGRARINVLSEIVGEWERRVTRWRDLNRALKINLAGTAVPDPNEEWFLYQTLIGAYPADSGELNGFPGRICDYLIKALREAEVHSDWTAPDEAYEDACRSFVRGILDRKRGAAFLADFLPFQERIAHFGRLNSLSQTLIKITAPGVPDIYQGTEGWDLSLVDPDNRRPVDYGRRTAALRDIRERTSADPAALIRELLSDPADGRIKLFLVHRALAARRSKRALFLDGDYLPLSVSGARAKQLIAFARVHKGEWAVCLAPRLLTSDLQVGAYPLGDGFWRETRISLPREAPAVWDEVLTGRRLDDPSSVGGVLESLPAGLIMGTR